MNGVSIYLAVMCGWFWLICSLAHYSSPTWGMLLGFTFGAFIVDAVKLIAKLRDK